MVVRRAMPEASAEQGREDSGGGLRSGQVQWQQTLARRVRGSGNHVLGLIVVVIIPIGGRWIVCDLFAQRQMLR
ncbi:hypothetical protein RC55_23955 [Herbaspirillum seropedicae]|nr:hypothetical protein ACP92_07360 [Herbaspirillum seropedicae]NQE32250.1 hypothetical protein [Herbaspirillum seropedicae]